METGSNSKIVAPVPLASTRAEQPVITSAVKTELTPEAAVQQAGNPPAVRFAANAGADFRASIEQALRDTIERNVKADPRTRELVFQAISKETGVIVRQVPDEATLQVRAYVQEMREAESKKGSDSDVRHVEKIA
jgi:uncharacterized FlaG/YvyC family protein